MHEIVCETCKKLFYINEYRYQNRRTRFCSSRCRRGILIGEKSTTYEYHKKLNHLLTAKCINCGEEFKVYKCLVEKGLDKFCSLKCYRKCQTTKIVKLCEECKTEFHVIASRLSARFCSKKCKGIWQSRTKVGKQNHLWSRVIVKCDNCGNEKYVPQFKINKFKKFFCSKICKGQWMSINIRAENHHWWRGGRSTPYPSDFNNRLKEDIRNRDQRRCFLCSEFEDGKLLDVHHIDYNKNNNRSDNLVSLCRKCHMKTNSHRSHWSELLSWGVRDYYEYAIE